MPKFQSRWRDVGEVSCSKTVAGMPACFDAYNKWVILLGLFLRASSTFLRTWAMSKPDDPAPTIKTLSCDVAMFSWALGIRQYEV